MSDSWPRILRDPIHNLFAFHNTSWDRLLLDLMNTREIQRWRRIKQLGFSELVFPGANQSRFAHSLKACGGAKDGVLAALSNGLFNRRLYKAVDVSGAAIGSFTAAVQPRLHQEPAPDDAFVDDTPADTPYKPYDPDAERPATQIYVEAPTGKPQEIRLLSDTIVQLRKRYELVRYYFPEGLRTDINAIAEATLRRGQR